MYLSAIGSKRQVCHCLHRELDDSGKDYGNTSKDYLIFGGQLPDLNHWLYYLCSTI